VIIVVEVVVVVFLVVLVVDVVVLVDFAENGILDCKGVRPVL
jgi:hypothetical protein